MKIKIESFHPSRIDEVLALWNQTLVFDPIQKPSFIANHLGDPDFESDLFLLAYDECTLIGFVYAIQKKASVPNDTAWIQCLGVDPRHRRNGIATRLMEVLLKELDSRNVKRIVAGKYSPSYLFPGIDETHYPDALPFFKKFGFVQTGESFGMSMPLHSYVYPASVRETKSKLQASGYGFSPYMEIHSPRLIHLLESQFKPSWRNTLLKLIKNGSGHQTIHIATYQDEVVGFTSRSGIDGDLDRFGPFGIHPEHRNQGLGEVLFHETMLGMRDHGSTHAFFKSTDAKASRFYQRQGMAVDRVFIEMECLKDNH